MFGRLTVATLTVASVGWYGLGAHAVQAQESCQERVPWLSMIGGDSQDNAEGDGLSPTAGFATGTGVAMGAKAGTATALGVGTAAAYAVSIPAAFMAGSMAACGVLDLEIGGHSLGGFLDGLFGASMQITPAVQSSDSITNTSHDCWANDVGLRNGAGISTAFGAAPAGGECRLVSMPGFSDGRSGIALGDTAGRYVVADNVERTIGGNVLPGDDAMSLYPAEYEQSVVAMGYREWNGCHLPSNFSNCYASPWNPRTAAMVSYNAGGWSSSATYPVRYYGAGQVATERLMIRCAPTGLGGTVTSGQGGVGGVCGTLPGRLFAVVNGTVPEIEAVFQPYPQAQRLGWARRWVVDVRCHQNTTGTWTRVEGSTWYDATVNQRIPIPTCGIGKLLTAYRIAAVPTGITCAAASGSGCDNVWIANKWTAPSDWLATATAPDWTACLMQGNECPSPAVVEGVCTWGTSTPTGDFCDPDQLVDAGELPTTQTVTGTPIPVTDAPVSTADPVTDPDEGGGGDPGGEVVVPIDPGDGGKCSNPSQTACFGPVVDLSSRDECWPAGWGWFNPAQWVLRPIKCAMVWAFVPDTEALGDRWTSLRSTVDTHAPFSWVSNGIGVGAGTLTGMSAAIEANDHRCITWLPAVDHPFFPDSLSEGGEVCLQALMTSPSAGELRDLAGDAVWALWAIACAVAAVRLWGVGKTETFYLANPHNPGGV